MAYQARSAVSDNAKLAFLMAGINDQPKSPEGAEASFRADVQIIEIPKEGGVTPVIQSTLCTKNNTDQ